MRSSEHCLTSRNESIASRNESIVDQNFERDNSGEEGTENEQAREEMGLDLDS